MECEVRHRSSLVVLYLMICVMMTTDAMMSSPTSPCATRGCTCTGYEASCRCDSNIQTVSLSGESNPYIRTLSVRGCQHVHIAEDALRNLTMLSKVLVRDVKQLVLAPRSLHGGHWHKNLDITISNTTIENLSSYVFQGNISQINLENCNIKQIGAYAFSSLTAPSTRVKITKSKIDRIAQQALKRITLTSLDITETEFVNDVPSKVLSEVEILESFLIDDCKFRTVKSSAFNVMLPRTVGVMNSRFGALEGDAFVITARAQIVFRNNSFDELHKGVFAGLKITNDIIRTYGTQDFIFDNNTIGTINEGIFWINTTSLKPRFNYVRLTAKCSCKLIDIIPITSNVFCTIENPNNPNTYQNLEKMLALECRNTGLNPWYLGLVIAACLLVLLIGGGVMIWFCKRKRTQKKWINNGGDEKNPNIIMPEPKTYRETEVHVIVERAELLTTDL